MQQRQKMAVVSSGKAAVTHCRVEERFGAHSRVQVRLETGRTHQIRVHMAHIRYPLVGDVTYGGRVKLPKGVTENLRHMLQTFSRQALHACQLGLEHPYSGEAMRWEAELPDDMNELLNALRQHAAP